MLIYILLLIIGIHLKMSTLYFVILGIATCLQCIYTGIELQKKLK